MYLAVDIGGTKTLLAIFSQQGQIIKQSRFATPKSYLQFVNALKKAAKTLEPSLAFQAVAVAAPGLVDRSSGVVSKFGNLDWHNVNIKQAAADLSSLPNPLVLVENDSNLGGLSEALLVKKQYKKVLYLTISTGIGDGMIIDEVIAPELANGEAGQMIIEHNGKLQKWEDFASGRALKEQYGKLASEINSPAIWKKYVKGLAVGINELSAVLTPDVIIIGGGVGAHFEKFAEFLQQSLHKYDNPMVTIPPIIKARRPEEAVIYGCYDLIQQSI